MPDGEATRGGSASGGTVGVEWVGNFDEHDLETVAALITVMHQDMILGERPYPASELQADLTNRRAHEEVLLALARDGDRVVGTAILNLDRSGSNSHIAWLEQLIVTPLHRRQGIATRLLDLVVEVARDDARTILYLQASIEDPAATGFAERAGATRSLVEHQNRLAVAELDRSMLEGWVEQADERATGYSLEAFDGPCPDDLLDDFARLVVVMDTAPHGDAWEPTTPDADVTRENGLAFARQGGRNWTVCARHDATGELVGYTELGFKPFRPWLAFQGDTGVEPAHRGLGLGRWLKATNALRLLDERPDVEIVDTGNAAVNAPMLAINHAMGFRPVAVWQDWELKLS